jgi:hypothetical protein
MKNFEILYYNPIKFLVTFSSLPYSWVINL